MTWRLVFSTGNSEIRSVPLADGEALVIGRNPDADVSFADGKVKALSRLHCRVRGEGGRAWVESLHNRSRILVNGTAIGEAHELKAGDEVALLSDLGFRFLPATEADANPGQGGDDASG